jgi:membrane protease YdiL (CAAX protease family)
MAVVAALAGTLRLHAHLVPLLLLYPLWGLVQQFLVQALVAANLVRVRGALGSRTAVVSVCAVLFGVVHLPDLALAVATFVLGVAFTVIYLRHRNLWPLGLYHGWLGAIAYFWVLARDPWQEVFG